MRPGVVLETSDVRVRAAVDPLDPNESAMGLAIRAYLAACALSPGVVLSPLSILLAGFGARRAFDGRARQPGKGASRPRGFREGEAIAEAARIGIPMSLPALFVAWGYSLDQGRSTILAAAAALARKEGAESRAQLLERAASAGASVFRGSAVALELRRIGSPAHGGLVSEEDFEPVQDLDHPAKVEDGLQLPWQGDARSSDAQVILTADRRGSAVALCYEDESEGVPLFEGELRCPLLAVPVLRGVPRVSPGAPLVQACSPRIRIDEASNRVLSVSAGELSLAVPS